MSEFKQPTRPEEVPGWDDLDEDGQEIVRQVWDRSQKIKKEIADIDSAINVLQFLAENNFLSRSKIQRELTHISDATEELKNLIPLP